MTNSSRYYNTLGHTINKLDLNNVTFYGIVGKKYSSIESMCERGYLEASYIAIQIGRLFKNQDKESKS